MNFRRGMARIGWSLLAVWVFVILCGLIGRYSRGDLANQPVCWPDQPCGARVNEDWIALIAMVVIPLLVWLCWRVLLWIAAGFMPDRVAEAPPSR